MSPTQLLPASRAFHTSSVKLPSPQINPIPVTTTLRVNLCDCLSYACGVIDGVLHRADLLGSSSGISMSNAGSRNNDDLYQLQRVPAQIATNAKLLAGLGVLADVVDG